MKKLLLLALMVVLAVPAVSFAKTLDEEKIMTDKSLKGYKSIGVKLFSTDDIKYENVDDEEMRKMKSFKEEVQEKLTKTLVRNLKDDEVNAFVIDEDGKNAGKADMIIDGRITMINLGSAAARWWVGFGAGSAGLGVKGELKDAKTGETLAKFEHENSSGMRDTHDKWEMVLHEAQDLGDKLTEFVQKLRK